MQKRIQAAMQQPVLPPASPAQLKPRHYGMAISFVLLVLIPSIISAVYLYTRAADQYASYVGFSVRSESAANPVDMLGGLGSLVGASSTTDTDVLYKFIQSRDLVERVNERLDLRAIWSKAPDDPIFRFRGNSALEDLVSEWERKVRIYYDNGMIDLRVLAFEPQDAQDIARAILDEGGILINQLNDIAREDALRYSRDELERAQERLREARQSVSEFRNRYQLVDPSADVQGQIGVVSSLQQQLAEQLVSLGLLRANAQPEDPRISQTELRIQVIREQIDSERQKFGSNSNDVALSDVVGQYEILAVDRQFAETSYTAALASYEVARAEAVRQSRYLAPYIRPTLAQEAEFPERFKLMVMIAGFLSLIWIIGSLIFYSLRDRR
ncbi:sugar transporter [Paracoccus sp. (in: a-proteobacteria)]|uniref:sugar transporter n=1 Tax=Paracoccus sp. TaxID=267 RepID=UPI00396CCB90